VWWRSLHQAPTVLRPGAPTIAGSMLAALLVAVAAFTLAWAYLITVRLRVGRLEERAATQALSVRTGGRPSDGQLPSVVGVQGRAGPDA
jgi:heme exporter protein C